jgi:electron transfer flavoprotein beta subunit
VVKEINEPRYPSFMGIRKASRAEIPIWTASDLGIVGQAAVSWAEIVPPPRLETRCEFIDGASPQEIAGRLVDRLVEEKVL